MSLMLFSSVVEISARVAATSKRSEKAAMLGDHFSRLEEDELRVVVAMLSGEPRQGKIGIGYRTLSRLEFDPATEPSITIPQIDELLERLAAETGPGSQERREILLTDSLKRCTPAESEFLMRLLSGGIRQGALKGVIIDAIAKGSGVKPAIVRRAAMLRPDLGTISAIAFTTGDEGLSAVGLEVLNPVEPMLAKTASSPEAAIAANGASSVEWKLDGVRVQVHRSGDDVRIYTRNLNDVTARLDEVVEQVRNLPAAGFVLDGELMALAPDGGPRPFVATMSRFGSDEPVEMSADLAPFFFDILHLDGTDLIDRPLADRLAVLADLLPTEMLIPKEVTDDPERAGQILEQARHAGHEGIMVKQIDSAYQAGRRGAAWLKVKPAHTLDLVVLAVEWGSGRRTGYLSNIHLGARDPMTGDFVMLGKTFKGMTDEMLAWQTERFLELETRRDDYTVFLRPEQVVEIAFDGIQRSTRYPGGMALRFARVKGYRDDKTAEDADTIDTVAALFRS